MQKMQLMLCWRIKIVHFSLYNTDEKRCKIDESKLETVLDILLSGKDLPEIYRDHQLQGKLSIFRECHIEPDWLLVYRKVDKELILYATATGSHADLFNM